MPGHEAETPPVILVVDDDPIMRTLVSRALEALDCREILQVEDGLAAREVLERQPIDLVITDVEMPGLDGLDLIRWANAHCPAPVLIILSGVHSFANAVQAVKLGAVDFLSKPPHAERLQLAVRNAWRHEQLLRERERLDRALGKSHEELASRVAQLESVCRMLEDQAEVIDQDLKRAEMIQRALLPAAPPRLPGFCVDALYRPGRHVGGDLYDVVALDERFAVIVIADASGHGVSAAMLSVLFKHRLRMQDSASGAPLQPALALAEVNQALVNEVPTPGVFVSAVFGLLDTHTGALSIASAGHPPLWWIRSGSQARAIERSGPALGLSAGAEYQQSELLLGRGDLLLLYTDGLLDGAKLDPDQVAEWYFEKAQKGSAILRRLYEATEHSDTVGDRDDVTIVLLQACDAEGCFDHSPEPQQTRPALATNVDLRCGECADYTVFKIDGRGTWTDSQAFYEVASVVADSGRSLSIDLSECSYLDSTFLGTIHELVARSNAAGGSPLLQGIRPKLRQLFEELCMDEVLAHAEGPARPLPDELSAMTRPVDDTRRTQLRVLRAHETLSSLSAANRDELQQVLESLRSELRHGS